MEEKDLGEGQEVEVEEPEEEAEDLLEVVKLSSKCQIVITFLTSPLWRSQPKYQTLFPKMSYLVQTGD